MEETGGQEGIGGLSREVQRFDANGRTIRAAEREATGARWQRVAAETRLLAEIEAAHSRLAAAHTEARLLGQEAVPAAAEAFTAVTTAYREGKLGLVQVLDAQQLLSETRLRHIDALEAYQLSRVRLERLVGAPLHQMTIGESPPLSSPQ